MKLVLFAFFLLSALTCAYFMVTFLRELKKAITKQEPPPVGLLIMVLVFIIMMLAEAIASVSVMIYLQ